MKKNIYQRRRLPIEAPEFLVLYNGKDRFPEEKLLRLSDAFLEKPHENSIELVVRVLNINYGHNQAILEKSKALNDYSIFNSKVQEYRDAGYELGEAIRLAVRYCQENNIMMPFLMEHSSEVLNMLMTEWKLEEAIAVEREEGIEEGEKRVIQAFLQKMSIEQVATALDKTVEEIEQLLAE